MDYSFEHEAYLKGYTAVCGIDEAGRGPLAGPVYAAAVWLPEGLVIDGLNDSKGYYQFDIQQKAERKKA